MALPILPASTSQQVHGDLGRIARATPASLSVDRDFDDDRSS
jgi:hypothetical protein